VFAVAGSATGQTGSSTGARNRTEILLLGTAGGPPLRLNRSEPATLLTVDGRPYLIDWHRHRAANAGPFVTHEIDREGLIFQDEKIRVTVAENSHYVVIPTGVRDSFKSYSYRIETPHGVIVFTGDTGPSDAVARLAKSADVLVSEVSYRDPSELDRLGARANTMRAQFEFAHLNSHSVGQLAARAQVKSVLFYHYTPNDEADRAAYISGVKKYFAGPVFAPADLDRYCLGSPHGRTNDPLAVCRDKSAKS
jgi:hypothetical protein